MAQNNNRRAAPVLRVNIPMLLQEPRISEADLSMAFHRILGVLDHDYCGEAWVIQEYHFRDDGVFDPVAFRNEIRNLQLQYANYYVPPHMRAAVQLASDRHYDEVVRRDNAAMNNNQ